MRFLIQRVTNADVTVEDRTVGAIGQGLCVFVGVSNTDTKEIADKMIRKLINLRIFSDENDKTNLNLSSVNGELLIISQFTLYADCRKGNRPSFTKAGNPEFARQLSLNGAKIKEQYGLEKIADRFLEEAQQL